MDDSRNPFIVKAQSGHDILLLGDVEMHSRFNPVQEAYEQVMSIEDKLEKHSRVLVLGSGLGYHIQQLEFKMRSFHKEPEIFVVEPNEEVAILAKQSHIIPQKHVTIFSGNELEGYYQCTEFVEFLNDKPLIVPHRATLNLENSFFKKFLSYKASNQIFKIHNIIDPEIQILFDDANSSSTLNQFLDDINNKESLTTDDFKLLAFRNLCDSLLSEAGTYEI